MHALLLASLLALPSTPVVLRPFDTTAVPQAPASTADVACDDGTNGGTLVQRLDTWYGNRFVVPCGAARLLQVSFVHHDPGAAGVCSYRLHLLDGACRELGTTPVQSLAASPDAAAGIDIDLSGTGWCVIGSFYLVVEPMTCIDGAAGRDCFPALLVDASSDGDAGAHCGAVSAPGSDGRQCLSPQSTDGRFFDFRLRARLECGAPGCTSPVRPGTWSAVKRVYLTSAAVSSAAERPSASKPTNR